MVKYKTPMIDYKKTRKSVAIPDQSMTVQEIVKRFVRGIPVDVVKRTPVYADQNEFDLEKLARMDFGEKHQLANSLADRAAELQEELDDRRRSQASLLAQEQAELAAQTAIQKSAKTENTTS